jgi:hypothetical protein
VTALVAASATGARNISLLESVVIELILRLSPARLQRTMSGHVGLEHNFARGGALEYLHAHGSGKSAAIHRCRAFGDRGLSGRLTFACLVQRYQQVPRRQMRRCG